MKVAVAALFSVLIFGVTAEATAAPVSYSFSGRLTDIRDSGAGISFGTSFAATYVHDDAPQTGSLIESGRRLYAGGQFGVTAGATGLLGGETSELQVFNDWSNSIGGYDQDDGYFVSSRVYDFNEIDFFLIQFDLWDFTGATLMSLEMPSHTQLTQLAANGRVWIRRFEGGTETGLAAGNFGSMVSFAVPEPATLLLSLGALSGLAWTRRNRVSAS